MKKKLLSLFIISLALILINNPVSAKTLLNETVTVSKLSRRTYSFIATTDGLRIKLSLEVISGDINVIVENVCEQFFIRTDFNSSGDYTITLGFATEYYVVLDNIDSFFSARVKFTVTNWTRNETIATVLGSVLGLAIISAITYQYFTRKKKLD